MSTLTANNQIKYINMHQKIRCLKAGHKSNLIQFVCVDQHCQATTRLGCITCFPEHDGHTQNHLEIEEFFKRVNQKEKNIGIPQQNLIFYSIENEYQNIVHSAELKKTKEAYTRSTQSKLKNLMQRLFSFVDRHNEYISHYIEIKSKSQELGVNLEINSYHDELERVKTKPVSQLENREIEFLLHLLTTNDYEVALQNAQHQRDQIIEDFQKKVDDTIAVFEEQFGQVMQNLDSMVVKNLGNNGYQPTQNKAQQNKTTASNKTLKQGNSFHLPQPNQSPIASINILTELKIEKQKTTSQSRSPIKGSPYNQRHKNGKTPERQNKTSEKKKKVKQPAKQRFLITTPDTGNDKFIYGNRQLETFIQYLQLNYLKEEYLNEHLEFLCQNYQEVMDIYSYGQMFGYFYNDRVTQKDKIQLVQEQKANLLKVLWENWMIEWLQPLIQQSNISNAVNVRVHEIEENYNGLIELLEKSMYIHGIVAWVVKQKLNRPKTEYHTWLILAQGILIKNQNPFSLKNEYMQDKVYRLYHIKSASKKDYRNQHFFEEQNGNKKLQVYNQQQNQKNKRDYMVKPQPKYYKITCMGTFRYQMIQKLLLKDSKILTSKPSYLLKEFKNQFFFLLSTYNLMQRSQNITLYSLEQAFDSMLVNFQTFVNTLYSIFKEQGDQGFSQNPREDIY